MTTLWTDEDTYQLEPPMLIQYEQPLRRSLNHAGAPGRQGRRRRPRRLLRHWACGLACSVSGAALAGGAFALATGHSGIGLAGVLLAAGVVTTWLSAPGGVGVTLAAWAVLLALFAGLGQVDMLAGFVVWLLLLVGLLAGIVRACR